MAGVKGYIKENIPRSWDIVLRENRCLGSFIEQFYQAIRRCWRFGQEKEVNVYVVIGAKEENILNNIIEKQKNHDLLRQKMIKIMSSILTSEIKCLSYKTDNYNAQEEMIIPLWLHEK